MARMIKNLKTVLIIVVLVMSVAIALSLMRKGCRTDKITFEKYGITVYYETAGRFTVDFEKNIYVLSFENGAKVVSEGGELIYQKEDTRVNLCETGNRIFEIDKSGKLID